MEQMDLFEIIPHKYPDFRDMSEEEIVDYIATAIGVDFKKGSYDRYIGKMKDLELSVKMSHYTYKEREGQLFISCDVWNRKDMAGCGVGCDSIQQAIELFRVYIRRMNEDK